METPVINLSAFELLVLQHSASTDAEIDRLSIAIKAASAKFQGYFHEHPENRLQRLQREIFLFTASIHYLEYHVNHAIIDDYKRHICERQIEMGKLQAGKP